MPVKHSSNNRMLPANARASDVAAQTIKDIMGMQKTKYMSSLRVQGYQGLLYNKLKQGEKCTCQSSARSLNARLGKDGKASMGTINQLLTGDMHFNITSYQSMRPGEDAGDETSSKAPVNKNQGVFDIVTNNEEAYVNGRIPIDGVGFGDNGPIDVNLDYESLAGEFDAAHAGFNDSACGICFGSGFVGGYAPTNTYRRVYPVNNDAVDLKESAINTALRPWVATSDSNVDIRVVFPRGALCLDSFKLFNGRHPVPVNFIVDGNPIANTIGLLKFCDGLAHTVTVVFNPLNEGTEWTHLEVQFAVSAESPYFEFPKISQNVDLALVDKTEPFQIIVGPNIPALHTEDIIAESTFGKILIVQNSSWWNTRERNTLGWECTVRVAQPQEMYNILPRRGRIPTKNTTTNFAHSNKPGNRT